MIKRLNQPYFPLLFRHWNERVGDSRVIFRAATSFGRIFLIEPMQGTKGSGGFGGGVFHALLIIIKMFAVDSGLLGCFGCGLLQEFI